MPWKSRSLRKKFGTGVLFDPRFGGSTDHIDFYNEGSQATYSEEHPLWPELSGSGTDVGGPFFTDKNWTDAGTDTLSWPAASLGFGSIRPAYTGPCCLGMLGYGQTTVLAGGAFEPTLSSELRDMAGPVIKNMSPTESEGNLSQMIGELRRDGVPKLASHVLQTRARDFRSYGKDYLNAEFGWKPFVSDLHDTVKAVKNQHTILQQFKRDSGKLIRRRATLPGWSDAYQEDVGNHYAVPIIQNFWYQATRPTVAHTTIQKKRWVSAGYSYYLDPGYTAIGKFFRFNQEADKLLGLSLSPEVLWEVAPWSWLADWESNTGNTISTLSDYINYGPVLRYAYVMETVISSRIYIGSGFEDALNHKHDLTYTYHRVTKTREPASPFTFAKTDGELNPQQIAILAALGVSKVP